MLRSIKTILSILNNNSKIILYSFYFVILSILDLIGFSVVGAFFGTLLSNESEESSVFLSKMLNATSFEISVTTLGFILIIIFFTKDIFSFLINRNILKFANNSSHLLRLKLIKNYQYQTFQRYLESNSSQYIQSVTEYCYLFNVCLVGVLKMFSDIILLIVVSCFFLFLFGFYIMIALFVLALVIILYDKIFKNYINEYGKKANISNKDYIKNVNEIIKGFREIRIYSKEDYFYDVFNKSSLSYSQNRAKSQIISIIPRYLIEFFTVSSLILLAIFFFENSSKEMISKSLTSLSMVAVAIFRVLPSFITIASNSAQIRSNKHTFDMLNEYVSYSKNSIKKYKDSSFYLKCKIETIELRNISFGYPGKEVFNKINLFMKLGEKILIKGKSGSGKTTLINLITGLLNPIGGEICINNDPKIESKLLLQQYTAYIPQQTFIIDDSIINNIAFGQSESELDKLALQKAINQSSLEEYIDSLQDKINTKVGEEGARISGGQRQRIALARAFYFNKKIIILDESTNSLDKKTENMILNEILRKSEDKIIILISHGDHDELSFDRKLIIKEKNILEK